MQQELPFSEIKVEEAAYLAGFFDGEGVITIVEHSGLTSYFLEVRVDNTSLGPLQKFKSAFGGKILPIKANTELSCKPLFRWRIGGSGTLRTLQTMLPFLDIKREKALKAIEFQQLSGLRSARRKQIAKEFREVKQ